MPFIRTAPRPPAYAYLFRYPAIAIAAVIIIFAAGTFVGMGMVSAFRSGAFDSGNGGSESLDERVQHLGTQYVIAIANWRRKESSTPGAEQGREAAFAALYGAASELQKLEPEDPQLSKVVRSIGELRSHTSGKNQRPEKDSRP